MRLLSIHRVAVLALCVGFAGPVAADDELGAASPAHARIVVGLERAFGVAFTTATEERSAFGERLYPKQAADGIVPWDLGRLPATYALQAPRVAADWVEGATTFGASATVWPSSLSRTGSGGIQRLDTSVLAVAIAPRLGWLFCDRQRLCFWAKAGVTLGYLHSTEKLTGGGATSSTTVQDSLVSLDLEPTLLVGIVPHLAAGAQATVDVPLVSSRKVSDSGNAQSDPAPWSLGVRLGIHVWF